MAAREHGRGLSGCYLSNLWFVDSSKTVRNPAEAGRFVYVSINIPLLRQHKGEHLELRDSQLRKVDCKSLGGHGLR